MMHFKILVIIFFFSLGSLSANAKELIKLLIIGKNTEVNLNVEVAKTKYERKKGLMFREKLHKNHGMLFIFPKEDIVNMWMKNTLIPLDIIFISKKKKIVDVKKNAKNLSNSVITSNIKSKYVLEVNAGLIEKLKIKIGDEIYFEEQRKLNKN